MSLKVWTGLKIDGWDVTGSSGEMLEKLLPFINEQEEITFEFLCMMMILSPPPPPPPPPTTTVCLSREMEVSAKTVSLR